MSNETSVPDPHRPYSGDVPIEQWIAERGEVLRRTPAGLAPSVDEAGRQETP